MIRGRPDLFIRQGAVVAAWRTYRKRKLGPYYHLVFRDEGRQKSIYLGRDGPLVAPPLSVMLVTTPEPLPPLRTLVWSALTKLSE